jgi:hypothetical protein
VAELRQTSFRAGEWARTMYGRTDLPAYAHALRRCRGFIVTKHGAAVNRPGTEFLGEVKDQTRRPRLIPFNFGNGQTFVLEFGHLYLRFWQGGGLVLDGGVPYELVTPYAAEHLRELKVAQSGDIITIAHTAYAPRELRRYANTNWTLGAVDFTVPGHGVAAFPTPAQAYIEYDMSKALDGTPTRVDYALTAILKNNTTGRVYETLPYKFTGSAFVKDPTVPAWASGTSYAFVPLGEGSDFIRGSNGGIYRNLQAPNEGHDPTSTVGWWGALLIGTYPVGEPRGQFLSLYEHKPKIGWTGFPTPGGTTLQGFRLYRGVGTTFGLLIDLDSNVREYQDDGTIGPDFAISTPTAENPFAAEFPGCVSFFEQRRIFARTPTAPADVLGSRLADYYNHSPRTRVLDGDAFRFTLAGLRYEEIRWLLPLRALLAGTNESAWVVSGAGGVNDVLSALSVRARVQNHRGASMLDPLVVGHGALVVSPLGNVVQELVFDFSTDSYQGAELSLLASHLLEEKTIDEWAFAREPYSVAWAVRSDGTLLGLSYVRDLEVVAWHWHDTDGAFESVCTVQEGAEDAVYVVVRRTIGGATKRYVERFASRRVADVRSGIFLDSSLRLDASNASPATLRFTVNAEDETAVFIWATENFFSPDDVGNVFVVDPDGAAVRLEITVVPEGLSPPYSKAWATVASGPLPAALRDVDTTKWARAVDELSGLDHLEGKTVSGVADGNLVEDLIVTGGAVTLPAPAVMICVGLPYVSELETLDLPGDDARSRTKTVKKVRVEVEASRGIEAGRDLEHLSAWQGRKVAHGYGPVPLYSGDVELLVSGDWSKTGRAALRQRHPFPVTVLGITREVELGGK